VLGRAGATTSAARTQPAAAATSSSHGATGRTSAAMSACTSGNGVNRAIVCVMP
jgi:hypothetical protein